MQASFSPSELLPSALVAQRLLPSFDYQRYLKNGLMIGSGVVESSNRRVVTQRLKQAGMHWSIEKSGRCYGFAGYLFK